MSEPYRASSWNSSLRNGEYFPDPFFDAASMAMPRDHRNVLRWAEFIWSSNGTYRSAMERVLSYFLTEIEVESPRGEKVGDDERDKYKDFLANDLNIITELQAILRDRMCYGNAFVSMLIKFHRILICPKCRVRHPLREVYNNPVFGFRWQNYEFHAKCQNDSCRHHGAWEYKDIEDRSENGLRLKRWNPHEIELIHDPFTDEVGYVWRIPEYYKRELRAGSLFVLERASRPVIEAVKKNWLFKFAEDQMFHMKEPTLGGLQNRGWGVPRTLVNFRQIWYVQVLRRYNEAIALDYIIPFRVITPAPRGGAGGGGGLAQDPLLTLNMGDFSSQVRRMLNKRRRDPASWHTLPFPINYQALGGEATALAPKELLDQGQQTLLNESSVPAELWSGTLSTQAAPMAMRLHEATWFHLVSDGDRCLQWLSNQLSRRLNWEVVSTKLRRVIYSDDVQRQQLALQLALSQQISMSSALKGLNYDFKEEQRRIADDTRTQAEVQADVQEEMDTIAMGQQIAKGQPGGAQAGAAPAGAGGMPAGGDPSQMGMPGPVTQMLGGPGVPTNPQDMMAQADELAQQLLGMPSGTRRSEISALKQKNETLATLVQAKMDRIRSDARSQGGAMLMGQQFGPQGQA